MFGKKQRQAAQAQIDAANAAAQAAMNGNIPPVSAANQAAAQDAMTQQRALGIDTAAFGGPSNAPVADDDPIFADIDGISLQHYAWIAKLSQKAGVTDESGMREVAAQNGIDPDQYMRGANGWTARMGQSMAVGQKFRQYFDQY